MAAAPRLRRPSRIDISLDNQDTLGRLEESLGRMNDNFSTQRDDVAALKLQQTHLQQQIANMSTDWKSDLQEITSSFRRDLTDVATSIERITSKLEARKISAASWGAIVAVALTFVGMFTVAAAFFVNAEIANAIAPLVQNQTTIGQIIQPFHDMEIASARSTAADVRSDTDRAELNRRMSKVEDAVAVETAQRREQNATLNSNRIEIETQFKNLTGQLYWLWHKQFGDQYPIVPRESSTSGGVGLHGALADGQ